MMRKFLNSLVVGAAIFVFPAAAQAAANCSASLSDIVFGEVYLRDALAQQTIGNLSISCTGGTASGEVRACLFIGQGSGGGTGTARYMRRPDGETLAYQLFSGGYGGTVWDEVEFAVPLDAQGAGQITAAVYAEILSSGSDVKGGGYLSDFSGGSDVSLRYGEGSCAAGATSTPNLFQVNATVSPHCTVTVGSMDFGDVSDRIATGAAAAASLSVTCTENAPYAITLGPGLGPNVSDPQFRRMSNGTQTLAYGLYQDSGGSRPWGWTSGQDDLSATGTGLSQAFTVHGLLHGGQEAIIGGYTDSVVVTVHY